jgi:2'-5' RNA ligase
VECLVGNGGGGSMRLFLAINLPDDVREHLTEVQSRLKELDVKASWTAPANLHVTLKFLGEVDERRVGALAESLLLVRVSGRIELAAQGLDLFPSRGPVRVVAAAMGGDGTDALRAVHVAVEQRCRHLGFEREQRAYRPHVTLARGRPVIAPGFRERAVLAAAGSWPGPAFHVTEFVLVQSRMSPKGSQYTTLHRFPLQPE